MQLLDLFCGAGGAAVGYYQAGFTEILGVEWMTTREARDAIPPAYTRVIGERWLAAQGAIVA